MYVYHMIDETARKWEAQDKKYHQYSFQDIYHNYFSLAFLSGLRPVYLKSELQSFKDELKNKLLQMILVILPLNFRFA